MLQLLLHAAQPTECKETHAKKYTTKFTGPFWLLNKNLKIVIVNIEK